MGAHNKREKFDMSAKQLSDFNAKLADRNMVACKRQMKEIKVLEEQVAALEDQVAALEAQNGQLNDDLNSSKREIATLQAENEAQREELQDKNGDLIKRNRDKVVRMWHHIGKAVRFRRALVAQAIDLKSELMARNSNLINNNWVLVSTRLAARTKEQTHINALVAASASRYRENDLWLELAAEDIVVASEKEHLYCKYASLLRQVQLSSMFRKWRTVMLKNIITKQEEMLASSNQMLADLVLDKNTVHIHLISARWQLIGARLAACPQYATCVDAFVFMMKTQKNFDWSLATLHALYEDSVYEGKWQAVVQRIMAGHRDVSMIAINRFFVNHSVNMRNMMHNYCGVAKDETLVGKWQYVAIRVRHERMKLMYAVMYMKIAWDHRPVHLPPSEEIPPAEIPSEEELEAANAKQVKCADELRAEVQALSADVRVHADEVISRMRHDMRVANGCYLRIVLRQSVQVWEQKLPRTKPPTTLLAIQSKEQWREHYYVTKAYAWGLATWKKYKPLKECRVVAPHWYAVRVMSKALAKWKNCAVKVKYNHHIETSHQCRRVFTMFKELVHIQRTLRTRLDHFLLNKVRAAFTVWKKYFKFWKKEATQMVSEAKMDQMQLEKKSSLAWTLLYDTLRFMTHSAVATVGVQSVVIATEPTGSLAPAIRLLAKILL